MRGKPPDDGRERAGTGAHADAELGDGGREPDLAESPASEEDEDRRAILARRNRFIAIALSGLTSAVAPACSDSDVDVAPQSPGIQTGPSGQPTPCLEAPPVVMTPLEDPPPTVDDTPPPPDPPPPVVDPPDMAPPRVCLRRRPPARPCLSIARPVPPPPQPPPQPCLSIARPVPPPQPPPPQPCLEFVEPQPAPQACLDFNKPTGEDDGSQRG